MKFDKWFNSQSTLVKVLLLILPVVGWIVELLVRLSVFSRTKSLLHLIVLVLFVVVGWTWVLVIADLVVLIVTGRLFLTK